MPRKTALVLLTASAAVAGCTLARYPEPPSGTPTATLTFHREIPANITEGIAQNFRLSPISGTGYCPDADTHMAAMLSMFSDHEDAHVAAGQRIAVLADTHSMRSADVNYQPGMEQGLCISAGSFVPEAGHSYQVRHTYDIIHVRCRVDVVDAATNAPPASLKRSGKDVCDHELAD